jgi:hypothetical protein
VHIGFGGPLQAFEKRMGTVSLLNSDGSLNLFAAPWSPISLGDLALAGFVGAVGFGASPNSSTPHVIAEFELSVNTAAPNTAPNGLYSPEPAFWSASTSPGGGRECFPPPPPSAVFLCPPSGIPIGPISSAIFRLNPDGTTTVVPVLGPDGRPLIQPVPGPATLLLLAATLAGLGLLRWRQENRA